MRTRLPLYCIGILLCLLLPCPTLAYVFDIRENFPIHTQGENGIFLQYREGSDFVNLINYNPFISDHTDNAFVFVNPDLSDGDHFPTIIGYEYNAFPEVSPDQISAAPACIPRDNINADAVMRINIPGKGGMVRITGSCGITPNTVDPPVGEVYFSIYKGKKNYNAPLWSATNPGTFDIKISYKKGDQLFFATNSGSDACLANDLAYWKDLKLITPGRNSKKIPFPLFLTGCLRQTGKFFLSAKYPA